MNLTIKTTSLLTVLCLSAALTISSCGKKTETTDTSTTKTETTTPATGASTAPTTTTTTTSSKSTAPAGADKPLSAAEKTQLTPVKTALVMANTALKGGDVSKAKTQFAKVSTLWPTIQPVLKSKAGTSYPAIESGIEMTKTAMSAPTPDKVKAGQGLTTAINAMNNVLSKK